MLDKRGQRKIVRVSTGNPNLTVRHVKSDCSFNSEGSLDTGRRVLCYIMGGKI